MRRWNLVALLLPLALFRPAPAAAQTPDANAALKYWQAFVLMPTLDKDQEKLLGEWNTAPIDEAARKLIAASEKSRLYLHRGAKLRQCDWSLDYQDGMELLLPYLAKSRDLARLAALHARHEIEQGRPEAALEDATAMLALARHAGNEPIMICILVRHLIESNAIELVAAYLPELRDHAAKFVAAYEALPAGATYSQAFLAEKKHCLGWLIKQLKEAEAKQKGSWRDVLKRACGEPQGEEVVKEVGTFERAVELLEAVLPVSDEMARLVALPREEFEKQYPEFKRKTKAANLLAGHLVTSADRVLAAENRTQAQLALLKAAMAVVEGGPDKLKDIKDPFGDGPFEYRALDKGFELKSKLIFRDQPVTLTVGQRKKG
jgi:hypothetical protein